MRAAFVLLILSIMGFMYVTASGTTFPELGEFFGLTVPQLVFIALAVISVVFWFKAAVQAAKRAA